MVAPWRLTKGVEPDAVKAARPGALHKQHDIKLLECRLGLPGVLEISCTHRLIPASDGLETSKEEGKCRMPEKGTKG